MTHSLKLKPASIEDYRLLAEKRLPRALFDYIDGAACMESTAAKNVSAFEHLQLRQRILKDVSSIDTATTVLKSKIDFPIILAPVGLSGSFANRGEVQAYKAANRMNVPFSLSTVGICSMEELHQTSEIPFWFQLYIIRDRSFAINLMKKASNLGCNTLILTVDLPVVGDRYRDIRNGLSGNLGQYEKFRSLMNTLAHPRWLWDVAITGKPLIFGNLLDAVPNATGLKDFKSWVDNQFDASMTWDDLGWIREHWKGNIVIKGIMDTEDAQQAINFGADAIVVSNHGGRQLDGAPATLDVLPEIAKTVDHKCQIIVDSGIRCGIDILKALASGADACMIGRAWAYALAAEGEQGVCNMLNTLQKELKVAMALTGVTKIKDIDQSLLR